MLTVDLEHDWFQVDFDAGQLSVEQMLETVREQGFVGRVIDPPPPAPAVAREQLFSLEGLPEPLQEVVERAREKGTPLLLSFHGPG